MTGVSARRLGLAVAAAVALWALATGSLLRGRGGLAGVYAFLDGEGRSIEVLRRTDAAIDFPVPQRLDAAYIFHWDYRRFGFPTEKPAYAVRWTGFLAVPAGGTYEFGLDVEGEATLRIDGEAIALPKDTVTPRTLAAGLHPIDLDYRLAAGEARLVLSWRPPGRRLEPIPTENLVVDRGDYAAGRTRRTLGWLLALAGLATGALVLTLGRRAPGGPAGRLLAALQTERPRLALYAILLLAAILRFHDYALVPFHHETADEYQHAWEGWHLLREGTPAAWSTFPDRYPSDQTRDFRWFGDRYVLVHPYFDHPPLFSIPVGLVCSLAGAPSFLDCTLPVMRLVPIVLSLVGLLMLHRLARLYGLGERAAQLACLVYATLPVIVLAHRLVKAESLLALLFMGALIAVGEAFPGSAKGMAPAAGDAAAPEQAGRRGALVAGLYGLLAILTKATGLVVPAAAAILLAGRRRWREAGIVIALASAGIALYALYAAAFDFGIWLKVLEAQATTKWVSMESFHDLLGGKVVVKWFGRGTYLWLLLAAAVAALGRVRSLMLPLVLYMALLALTADHRVIYGWYRIPLYPFLCVAAGLYLDRMLDEADLASGFIFAVTAVLSALLYALPEPFAQAKPVAWLFAVAALLPFLPRLVVDRPWSARLARAGTIALLVLFVLANVATVKNLLPIYSATRGLQ